MWILLDVLLVLGSAACGYLVRRWHRPVGYTPPPAKPVTILFSGGSPYYSLSVSRPSSDEDESFVTTTLLALRSDWPDVARHLARGSDAA